MCSDAPDTTAQNKVADQQIKLSQEQLDWAKQIYAESAPDRANATTRANAVSDKQMAAMDQQQKLTQDYADYNKNTFRPLEEKIVADSQNYDTPERQESEAARAGAGITQAFTNSQSIQDRSLARMGVNPNSGKAVAASTGLGAQRALAVAGAENSARKNVETVGYARKMDAVNLGRNLASNQATSAGIALNQGNSAVSNAQVGSNIAAQGAGMMNSGYSGAQQGLNSAAGVYSNIANTQAGVDSSNSSTAVGAGTAVAAVAIAI